MAVEIPETLVKQIAAGFLLSHAFVAGMLSAPEIVLTEGEAESLSKAVANVAKHYPPLALTGKRGAWIGLATTAGFIYGPRLWAFVTRKQGERTRGQSADTN